MAEVEKYLTDEWGDIQAHFAALDRFEKEQAPGHVQNAAFQKQRRWEEMQKLRGEAKVWLAELKNREDVYRRALQALVEPNRPEGRVPAGRLESLCLEPRRADQFRRDLRADGDRVVPAAGALHAVGGLGRGGLHGCVVMTQPAWPGIFPPDPAVTGHALLINKDFIEMLALLVMASVPAGRWGGLDYFLYHFVFNPFLSKRVGRDEQ